jgi:hypothetical protein
VSLEIPAAHSMDTTWFGVDLAGNVGVFDTGEPGALPQGAAATAESVGFDDWPLWVVIVSRALAEGDLLNDKAITVSCP